jgi:hypothetical protein
VRLGVTHVLADGHHVADLSLDELPRVGDWITWKGSPARGAEVVKVLRDYRGAQERGVGDGERVAFYAGFVSVKVME